MFAIAAVLPAMFIDGLLSAQCWARTINMNLVCFLEGRTLTIFCDSMVTVDEEIHDCCRNMEEVVTFSTADSV